MERLDEESVVAVPTGMTLRYRIAELVHEDGQRVIVAYNQARAHLPDPALAHWDANHSLDEFDASFGYKQQLAFFEPKQGRLNMSERKTFDKVREKMDLRVIRDTHALFVSCNNAGSKIVVEGFNPTVVYVDESGQAPIPAFCVPLTAFKKWQAVMLYGDPK